MDEVAPPAQLCARAPAAPVMSSEPSPSMSMTVLFGEASFAPMAAGRPKPIVPAPPLVTSERGACQR